MNDIKPRVIAFVSGKGGSGKTTSAIAISKLLADMGYPSLLIDFDLATNGGSYFFKKQFTNESEGIWEVLADSSIDTKTSVQLNDIPIIISKDFYFVASRVKLNIKGESYDSVTYNKETLKKDILIPLIDWSTEKGVYYVLIDCQAGYSISSAAAAEVADTSIIVTEADSISSDAADNLLIQLGTSLPSEKRYLVNKIDIRDAETYRNMRNVFQSLNRLPPLPFDFAVRNAFGARQIPIDINNPSPLLFALFETIKYIFTEIFDEIESYKAKHVDFLFEKYDEKLQHLMEEKEMYEREYAEIKTQNIRLQYNILKTILGVLGFISGFFLVIYSTRFFGYTIISALPSDPIFIIAMISLVMFLFSYQLIRKQFRTKVSDEIKERELSQRIKYINEELDSVRSLLLAKSKESLVDIEVIRQTKRMNNEEKKYYKKAEQ